MLWIDNLKFLYISDDVLFNVIVSTVKVSNICDYSKIKCACSLYGTMVLCGSQCIAISTINYHIKNFISMWH